MPLDQEADVPVALASAVLLVLVLVGPSTGLDDTALTGGCAAVVAVTALGLRLRMALLLAGVAWVLLSGCVDGRHTQLGFDGRSDCLRGLTLLAGALVAQRAGHYSRGTCRSPLRAASTSATWRPVATSRRPSRS